MVDIAKMIGDATWRGLVAGIIISCTFGLMAIPFSVMMNAYIHHHPLMRLLMGLFGGGFMVVVIFGIFMFFSMLAAQYTIFQMIPPFVYLGYVAAATGFISLMTTIYALIFMRGRHYFGLFPLVKFDADMPKNPERVIDWPIFIWASIGRIIGLFFIMFQENGDSNAYATHLEQIYAKSTGPFVNIEFNAKARTAAAFVKEDKDKWIDAMNELENDEKNPYTFFDGSSPASSS
jgi:hypothetical protein